MLRSITKNLYHSPFKLYKYFSSTINVPSELIPVVPKDSIKKSFSCSGGPGGQHVNKVATKAEIRFCIDDNWIPERLRNIIAEKYAYRLNSNREIVIYSSKTRSQVENLDDCFEKLNDMLYSCAVQVVLDARKNPSGADAQILDERKEKAAYFRRVEKERHSIKKRFRSQIYD